MARVAKKKETEPGCSQFDWKRLCAYIEQEILGYTPDQKLQRNEVMKVQGLRHGKVYGNRSTENNGNYSYVEILQTFKVCREGILEGFKHKGIDDPWSKLNYACGYVRNNINSVVYRMRKVEASRKKAEEAQVDVQENASADYVPKSLDTSSFINMESLW